MLKSSSDVKLMTSTKCKKIFKILQINMQQKRIIKGIPILTGSDRTDIDEARLIFSQNMDRQTGFRNPHMESFWHTKYFSFQIFGIG